MLPALPGQGGPSSQPCPSSSSSSPCPQLSTNSVWQMSSKRLQMSNVAQGRALQGREFQEGEYGECAVLGKICPWQRGLWHGLPKEKGHEKKSPPAASPASLHSRSAWSVGARWDVALPLTMVSAVRCAKRARAPTSPAASARDSTGSGAASPGHSLPGSEGCSSSLKALKDSRDVGIDPSSLNQHTGTPQPHPCPSVTRALLPASGTRGCWMYGNTSKLGAVAVPSPRYLPWRPRTARAPSPGHPWTPAPPAPGSAGNLQGISFHFLSMARLGTVCTSADSTRHH